MRTYLETHPWLTFTCDLRKAGAELWLLLGEAASKCEHISRVPLRPNTSMKLHQVYLAKGVAATTAIEGNTLSEAHVLKAVESKLQSPSSKEYMQREVENIIAVCNEIAERISSNQLTSVSPEMVCEYNRKVLDGLREDDEKKPGEIRSHSVGVRRYRGAPAEDCLYLLGRLFDWLNGPDFQSASIGSTDNPIIIKIVQAVLAHLYLAWIHPFGDGNGRTARLVEFHLLISARVPSPAAHLFSNHYNQTRSEYYRQLDYASKSGGDVLPFLLYAVRGFVDGLREQLEWIWEQQWDIVWENYIHDLFRGKAGATDARLRNLALDLGDHDAWIDVGRIPDLSPRLAKAYAGKTPKTLQRDLNALIVHDLIERDGRKVRARRDVIQRFLPLRKTERSPA